MINITDNEVIISRDIWDKLSTDVFFDEILHNIIDSESLKQSIVTDSDFMDAQ